LRLPEIRWIEAGRYFFCGARVCDPQQYSIFKTPPLNLNAFLSVKLLRVTDPRSENGGHVAEIVEADTCCA
jgi:hypothetical protein